MSVWLRFAAASALLAVTAVAAPARAQGNSERAEALNTEGKELFRDEDYEAALDRFERAVELNPDPRFHFNVCFTLYMLGDLQTAKASCYEVQPPEADEELVSKRDHVLGLIDEEMAEQPPAGDTQPPGGGDPDDPANSGGGGGTGEQVDYDPSPGGAQGGGTRRTGPPPRLPQEPEIPHNYNWSLGAELGPLRNLGLGGDNYADSGVHLRGFADFVLSPPMRLGLQAYLDLSRFELAASASPDVRALTVVDIGGAFYQHIPLLGRLYFTPLGGAHFSVQQPDGTDIAFGTLGVRAQASLNYVFGAQDQHVLSVTPVAANLYLPASGAGTDLSAAAYGLDSGSATYTFTVGYTMRFAEPFGGSLITLE